jgi:hypothetical protein
MTLLRYTHLVDHFPFLERVYTVARRPASSWRSTRLKKIFAAADSRQLQVVVRVMAAVVLKEALSPEEVRQILNRSRRKTYLKKLFSSCAAVKRLLKSGTEDALRKHLLRLTPALAPLLSTLFE